jgi:hypothetical protein
MRDVLFTLSLGKILYPMGSTPPSFVIIFGEMDGSEACIAMWKLESGKRSCRGPSVISDRCGIYFIIRRNRPYKLHKSTLPGNAGCFLRRL